MSTTLSNQPISRLIGNGSRLRGALPDQNEHLQDSAPTIFEMSRTAAFADPEHDVFFVIEGTLSCFDPTHPILALRMLMETAPVRHAHLGRLRDQGQAAAE